MNIRLLLAAAIWILTGSAAVQAQVIVANPKVKIDAIAKSDLRDIFTGASSNYGDGSRAVPVILQSGPVQEKFLKNYVGKSDAAFRAAWRSVVFSGQGTLPRSMAGDAAAIDYIASVPGAIGYVGTLPEGAKVKSITVK